VCPPGYTNRRHNVFYMSVRPSVFVRYKTGKHDISKINEPILMPIGSSGPRSKGMKRSSLGVRRSKVKVTHTRPKLDVEAWQRHHS